MADLETVHATIDHTGITGVGASGAAVACKAYRNTTQALSASTLTDLLFNAEELDTDGFHDNSTNPDRFTVPTGKGGVYLLTGYLYTAVSGSIILGRFTVNATAVRGQSVLGASTAGGGCVVSAGPVSLAQGDIVRLQGWINSANNLGDASNAEQQIWAALVRIGS